MTTPGDRLIEALEKFDAKWDEVRLALDEAFVALYFHNGRKRYDGPTIGAEVEVLREALPLARQQAADLERYKAALEQIGNSPWLEARAIARQALEGTKE